MSITTQSVERRARIFATNMGDPLSSNLNQMTGRHLPHLHVVRSNKVGRQVRKVPIEEQIRRPVVTQLIKVSQVHLTRSDQQNVYPSTQQGADLLPLHVRILLRRSQNQRAITPP